jgi:hypothetical protein
MRIATDDDRGATEPATSRFFRFPLGSVHQKEPSMPPTTSLLALAGVVGFALLSLLFGILT